jgi:hypothetical protein
MGLAASGFMMGARDLEITPITADTTVSDSYAIGTMTSVKGLTQANWSMPVESFEHRGDDQLLEISNTQDGITVDLQLTGLSPEILALVMGGTFNNSLCGGEAFQHDLKDVNIGNTGYFRVTFLCKMVDDFDMQVIVNKAKVSTGPSSTHQDKTPQSLTLQIRGVTPHDPSVNGLTVLRKTS